MLAMRTTIPATIETSSSVSKEESGVASGAPSVTRFWVRKSHFLEKKNDY